MTSYFPIDETELMRKINENFFLKRNASVFYYFFSVIGYDLRRRNGAEVFLDAYFKRKPTGHINIYGMPILSHILFMPNLLNPHSSI